MDLTRRELLTLFLGAPFAFQACSESMRRPFPAGEIVGQSAELGHILRGLAKYEVPSDHWETRKVVIVGGGVAGLTAAWKLKREGTNDFTLVELEKDLGGTSRSGQGEPVGYPWAAHYLPVPLSDNRELIELLDEMSLVEGRTSDDKWRIREEFLCRDPEERVFYKGRWYDGLYLHVGERDEDRRQFAEFQRQVDGWVDWRDGHGRRAFVVPSARCSDDAEATALDKISFADWLRQRGLHSERLIWYCDYACRDDYGLTIEQTSAWAGLFYFCSRVPTSGAESQPFITFPEGNGRIVSHFVGRTSEHLRRSMMAVEIVPNEMGADVICLDNRTLRGIHAEKVIFAAPLFTVPYLVRGFRDNAPFEAAEFQHNAWFVANLFLKDRPKLRFARDFPLAWDNVLYESPSLGYVNATHQKGIDYGPTVFTYYYPMCEDPNGRTTLFNYGWQELADVCLTDLSRAHPDIYDLTTRIDIMRWGHAMVSPRPNFIWSGIREKVRKPYRHIHFAHTDLSGIALFEEAFYHGVRVAGEIISTQG